MVARILKRPLRAASERGGCRLEGAFAGRGRLSAHIARHAHSRTRGHEAVGLAPREAGKSIGKLFCRHVLVPFVSERASV